MSIKLLLLYAFASVSVLLGLSQADIPGDKIVNLPGLAKQPFYRMYSGYLNATGTKKFHYWFVESQGSFSDPVVLWLNGGPGCSSMDGLLSEHGPFKIQDDGATLKDNPYSWNKIAHVLYLESPAGVGYSYSDDRKYATDDDQVSLDNYEALKIFFTHFSEYRNNEFFITGESYGGIYVPTLAERVIKDSSFNFKGMAIGNGLTDYAMLDNSIIYFGYYHGLFGTDLWNKLVEHCCVQRNSSNCNFYDNHNQMCQIAIEEAQQTIQSLNIYNLYQECYGGATSAQLQLSSHKISPPSTLFFTNMFSENRFIKQQREKYKALPSSEVELSPPCINSTAMTTYLNTPKVRQALHIPKFLPRWTVCSAEVGMGYRKIYSDVREQYLKVLSSGDHRILVYNGDVDMACNFLGDEWFVDSLGQPVVTPRQSWYYYNNGVKQVAGFVKQFKHLTFLTIKGSGHMVPQDKPNPAYVMFEHFILNKPY